MEQKVHDFMTAVAKKNVGETEFLQAVEEVAEAIIPFMEANPKYNNKMLLERMVYTYGRGKIRKTKRTTKKAFFPFF